MKRGHWRTLAQPEVGSRFLVKFGNSSNVRPSLRFG